MSEQTDVIPMDPEAVHTDPELTSILEAVFAEADMSAAEAADDAGEYQDESDKLWIGREFSSVAEFARWFGVQQLGSRPYNAIGYHHTESPTPDIWAGLASLTAVFNYYYQRGFRPWGFGPHLWVYAGNGPWRSGTPHIYVATHPAHDAFGIEGRNGRWLHIEHIHNGDFAPFPDVLKRVSGELLAAVCSPHPHAPRQIPLRFVRDGGINNPEQPLGIMYHRDQNPDWVPGAWPKTCPGTQVSHANLDPDLLATAEARTPWVWSDSGEDPVDETGALFTVDGATARREPSRQGDVVRQHDAGLTIPTSGYTNRGEVVAGSPRWYRLGDDNSWVHSSGGSYTAAM